MNAELYEVKVCYSSAMEHTYERAVSKLRFYKSFQKNMSLFKTQNLTALLEQIAYYLLFYTKKKHVH